MKTIIDPVRKQEILDAYQAYFDGYTGRDWQKMIACFSDGFSMYGTGIDEVSFDKESSLKLFQREFEQSPDLISYQIKKTEVFEVTGDVALIMMVTDLRFLSKGHVVDTLNNRTTAVMKRWNGGWKLAHAHWSQPDSIQEVGESVPYKKLVEKTHELEKLVKSRTREIEAQNVTLKNLNETKTRLFSIIGHDLKNPFNSILGFSELLIERIDVLDRDKILRYLRNIHSQSGSTYRMLENLLEWARLHTEDILPDMQEFELGGFTTELLEGFSSMAEGKRIRLSNKVPGGIRVRADRHMLQIIMGNLISNAIKFTCPEGSIIVGCETRPDEILVQVTDTGVGMSEEVLERLFNMDVNLSLPGTDKERGTGLGLTLCREFAEKMGADMRAVSRPGKGSRFICAIPAT